MTNSDFTNVEMMLPDMDLYKSIGQRGLVKAGFARVPYFDDKDSSDPPYFMHCCYLESVDGQQYLILQGDVKDVPNEQLALWRDQINAAYGIPQENIMQFWTHVHNNRPSAGSIFPLTVIQQAMDNAAPVEIGFLNKDMGTSHNMNRNVMTDATHWMPSYTNNVYDSDGMPTFLPTWEYDNDGNIVGGSLDASPISSVQTKFDGPLDSYLQMLVFRTVDTHAMRAIMVKFTGHPVMRDYVGDIGRHVMDDFQAKYGANVEVMYGCGYGGDHRFLAAQHYPLDMGSGRTVKAFGDALDEALPTMEFAPLTKVGIATGFDGQASHAVQAVGMNDNYLSVVPSEAPSEEGLYVRARTCDLKTFYNAYGNGQLIYFYWGRLGAGSPDQYGVFFMAQNLIRCVNILECSLTNLPLTGDVNRDGYVNVGDLQGLAAAWASQAAPPAGNWNADADLNSDGYVNVGDLQILVVNWGNEG